MPTLKVQLNHPGAQKPFSLTRGYRKIGSDIIREWNNDTGHYRKFLNNFGYYVSEVGDTSPKSGYLHFWGEWEGNSYYNKYEKQDHQTHPDYRVWPNGVHEPFHSILLRGHQNTDPYIFGDFFKYCICKQRGAVCSLDSGSLILFGSTYPALDTFFLDTVFVIESYVPAVDIFKANANGYKQVYRESTLEQVGEEYLGPHASTSLRLYHGRTWEDNNNYFSFVPCKIDPASSGFPRLRLELSDTTLKLSRNPTGVSFLPNCKLSPEDLWSYIAKRALDQGFSLGYRFDEPSSIDNLLEGQAALDQRPPTC